MTNKTKSEPIIITPGIAGYFSVKTAGNDGSFRDWNAVGKSLDDQHDPLYEARETHMNKGCCYKHSGTEVLTEEESAWRNLHPFDLLCHDRKAGSTDTGSEDNDWG